MVFDYNSYVKVVILGNLCGGALQDPPRRVSREISPSRPSLSEYPRFLREIRKVYLNIFVFLEKDAKFICVPLFSSRNTQSLSAYPCFLREIRKVYLRTLVSPEKSGPVYLRTLIFSREKGMSGWLGRVFLEKKACLDGWGAYFSRKRLVWMAGARISREKGLFVWLGRIFLKE